jgi:DNA-directed RNA polymerase specialized sigma24 family protein
MVQRAAQPAGTHARPTALESLLRRYLPAMRAHLIHGRRLRPEQADEVLQSFVASKVLEQQMLAKADQSRGRFRNYLLTVLDRHHIDWHRTESARQRRMEVDLPDLPDLPDQVDESRTTAFEVAWATALLEEATTETQRRLRHDGREDLWDVFQFRVLDPILNDAPPPPYEAMLDRFGFSTATQACSAVLTARRTFARVLRELIAQYAGDDAGVDEEIDDLYRILSARPA